MSHLSLDPGATRCPVAPIPMIPMTPMDSYDSYDSHGFLWIAMDSYGCIARPPLVIPPVAPRYSHGSRNLLAWVPFVLLSSFSYARDQLAWDCGDGRRNDPRQPRRGLARGIPSPVPYCSIAARTRPRTSISRTRVL